MGGVHGDMIRNIYGQYSPGTHGNNLGRATGVFRWQGNYQGALGSNTGGEAYAEFMASLVVPTGAANKPRGWGALACAYLGQPAS